MTAITNPSQDLLNEQDVARITVMSPATVRGWSLLRQGPALGDRHRRPPDYSGRDFRAAATVNAYDERHNQEAAQQPSFLGILEGQAPDCCRPKPPSARSRFV
jgi:hypothetical protein